MYKFRWDGSYETTSSFLGHLPYSYIREKERAMRRFGNDTLIDLQLRIQSGTTGAGLSEKYIEWKAGHGLEVGHLLRTKAYLRCIKIDHTPSGFNIYPTGEEPPIHSGGEKGTVLNPNPRDYEYIAMKLEYGTPRMPARPHWNPTARRAAGKFPGVMRGVVDSALQRARAGTSVSRVTGYTSRVDRPPPQDDYEE